MLARLTLIGIESELKRDNKSITDYWELESESFNKELLFGAIIRKGGSMPVLYPDPDYFYLMSHNWWDSWKYNFNRWFETLYDLEYNPLENYDRNEEWTDTTQDNTGEMNAASRAANGALKNTNDSISNSTQAANGISAEDSESENKVSAYDSSTYSPKDKNITDNDRTDESSNVTSDIVAESQDQTNNDDETSTAVRNTDHNGTATHEGRVHGNIGVTTSQQMAESELKLRAWGIYDHMADIFIKNMMIAVY